MRAEPGSGVAVATLPFADWTKRAADSPMAAIAKAVLGSHSYLIPGGKA
jgi:hypothetical protein